MKNKKTTRDGKKGPRALALHYMKTLVEVARESFLILGPDLKVISASPIFYKSFRAQPTQTEHNYVYALGNGQWDIAELRSLLEEILPEKKVVKDYKVTHVFEAIGERTMLLNARQIDSVQLIILAIEDITERMTIEKEKEEYTKKLEDQVKERTQDLLAKLKEVEAMNKSMVGRELKMVELKKEIEALKKRLKNGNGNHKNDR